MSFKSLGNYVTLQRGNTYKSRLLGLPGPILLGLASILPNGGFRDDSLKSYGGESSEKILLKPGDIYVSLKDVTQSANLLGAVSRVPDDIEIGRLTQDTVKLVFRNQSFQKSYIYWILRTPNYREYCRNRATGTTNLGLDRNDFLEYPIPDLTPQREQFVELFEQIEKKIELNRRMNETLESIARAIFKSWFIDFDPVRAKSEGKQPEGMDAETAALFPSEFETVEGQEIPKGWHIKPIGDVLEVKGGSTPSTENKAFWGGDIPFCTPKDLSNSKTPFILLTERTITELGVCEISSGILPIGTVLLSSRAPIGYVSITITPISINQGFIALIPNESCNNYFIFEWLKANMELIIGNANGTTFLEISKKNFKPLSFCLPPKKLMQAYNLLIDPIFTKIKSNLIQNQELSELRDTLLPKLLSGELPIDNPEQFTNGL